MLKFIQLNDDKTPATSFDVHFTNLAEYDNAGLFLNNKTVVVDFDGNNYDDKKLYKYLDKNNPTLYVETTRGRHYYYRVPDDLKISNGSHKICVCGYEVDYKTGTRQYTIVKRGGVERPRNRDLTLTDLPELPKLLYPLYKSKKNLTVLAEGDGRNDSMFSHLMCIKDAYKNINIKSMGTLINSLSLAEKLDKKELEALLNSVDKRESSNGSEWNGKPSDYIGLGSLVAEKLDVKVYNGKLYFKHGKNYSKDEIKLDRAIDQICKLNKAQFTNINTRLFMEGEMVEHQNFKIKCRNGCIVDGEFIPMDCGFTPFYLDVEYNPDAKDDTVDYFMEFISNGRKDLEEYIEEILGHTLLVDKAPHKMFFLSGAGSNGKSTFMEMLGAFSGELASFIDLKQFDDGTSLLRLTGKIVNISDDVDATYLENSKNLKTMASGNTVSCRAIYGHPVDFRNTATLIFSNNEPPTFKDKSYGIKRRLVIVPFDKKVTKRIPNIEMMLSTDNAKSCLLNRAMRGLNRIIKNGYEMTKSPTIDKATNDYHIQSDNALSFLADYGTYEGLPFKEVYDAYEEYAKENNYMIKSTATFSKTLKSLGYTTTQKKVQGKNIKFIIKE